jgi:peptide/nickel transport system substrate-binding protein
MKKNIVILVLSLVAMLSLVLASCAEKTSSTTSTTTTTSIKPATTTTSQTVKTNWWDKYGTPKYGGTITLRTASIMTDMDPYSSVRGLYSTYSETLFHPDWMVDRQNWAFSTMFTPPDFLAGMLAESWEQTDPSTLTIKLRQGIHWQNKAPTNGRELTAEDIQYHYDRMLGTGGGFTQPSSFNAGRLASISKVTAVDKYTVQVKYKSPGAVSFLYLLDMGATNTIEPREWVELSETDRKDWHNAAGAGAWILSDWISGTSDTYTKNPDYYGYDERYPKNKLPYADSLKEIQIPDPATALASLRSGKIDLIESLQIQQSQSLTQTNPEIKQGKLLAGSQSIVIKYNTEPFDDIRVRKAMQLAVDIKTIAATHYKGMLDGLPCGMFNAAAAEAGYGSPYKDWPQSLKDEYAYNPAKARELLAEAGYPDGFKTNVVVSTVMTDMELAQIFKAGLLEIGIDMEIRPMEQAAYNAFVVTGKHDQLSWTPMGKTGSIINVALIVGLYKLGDHANGGKVDDPAYNAMLNEFYSAATLDEAKAVSRKMDQWSIEQHWHVSACPTASFNAWQPSLNGYGGEALGAWTQGGLFSRLWKQ